ncbi:MAG: energy-coupling factor transporter ATPase [Emergencia sp.]|jgi:energy-coupling factor transport system ATP-binding protein|uniref:Energy-coupling factor transporter ATP-binding protein EcfA2 n=1 Tax=Anaerotruncus colihominis TaxID=169435 RepID=A0A845QNT3_9FIRM|nr:MULTISPECIES: energy-coupling factor transporter ATPase [Anaerotruncus]MCI9475224.1 energy-coupling factor transporter ATPase [Emergencia sp.]NBH61698.1 energy-coupling factor transporter ATPase [Anaerotruncus colihominis]NCF02353.1 energy-coupling factor transporter ATPase [Anaerotruncus sp. 80]
MSIQVRNLSHIYSKGMPDEQKALDNINFNIYDGEIVGVIGHTGSGKSTLLQHLNGLLKADSGSIEIDGIDITKPGVSMRDIRKKVGLVFQYPEYQLFEETVALDVAFGPKNLGLSPEEIDSRVKEGLELVGLSYEDIKDRSPFELSGGQKRRVAIAGVIAMKPHVLILDEPTAGLDPGAHKDILSMIEQVHESQNNIILFVSHNMADVAALSDKVLVMDEGKLVMAGTPKEIFAQRDRLAGIGLSVPPVTELMCQLKEKGVPVEENILSLKEATESIYEYLQRKS